MSTPEPTPDPAVTAVQWRVERRRTAGRVAVAVAIAAGTLILARDGTQYAVGLFAAAAAGVIAARDLLLPVRLAADIDGVTILTGVANRRRIPWRAVERVRVDNRDRLGMRQVALEIDEGEALHLLNAGDLGADPHEVAATLSLLRTGR
jgi:hypothetical protein